MNYRTRNMFIYLSLFSILLACNDNEVNLLNPENPLKGKAKAVLVSTANGNKITTEWVYDATSKQLIGSKQSDSLAKTSQTETFKRDTDGKMLSIAIEKKASDGTKTTSEKVYKYNDKNQLLSITETTNAAVLVEDFTYDTAAQLIKYSSSSKTNGGQNATLQTIQYTWTQGNVSNKTERSLAVGYEEEDYQYGTTENVLAKFYKEELKIDVGSKPEMISKNALTSSVRLFEGSRFKYEYDYNQSNQLIAYKILLNKNGTFQNYSEMKIIYHE
jgi:hypothetical protein